MVGTKLESHFWWIEEQKISLQSYNQNTETSPLKSPTALKIRRILCARDRFKRNNALRQLKPWKKKDWSWIGVEKDWCHDDSRNICFSSRKRCVTWVVPTTVQFKNSDVKIIWTSNQNCLEQEAIMWNTFKLKKRLHHCSFIQSDVMLIQLRLNYYNVTIRFNVIHHQEICN